MRAVIGEFADYVVASQRVEPAALLASGFTFEHPDLDGRRQVAGAALIALIRHPCGPAHEREVELTARRQPASLRSVPSPATTTYAVQSTRARTTASVG